MNSIIEAQQEFSNCFGELCISDLCKVTILPSFSREAIQYDEFIEGHKTRTGNAIIFNLTTVRRNDLKIYIPS